MGILEHYKDLVRKALPHPFQAFKIEDDLLKTIQPVADTLCLGAGHRRSIKHIFQRDMRLGEAAVNIGLQVENLLRPLLGEVR